jgi:hypothetical protein
LLSNRIRRACLLVFGVIVAGAITVPAASATPVPPSTPCATGQAVGTFQPLQVCASFDKTSYKSSEPITVTITITNLGQSDAQGVWLDLGGASFLMPSGGYSSADDDINNPVKGIDIPPGATVTATGVGFAADAASGFVEFNAAPTRPSTGPISRGSISSHRSHPSPATTWARSSPRTATRCPA